MWSGVQHCRGQPSSQAICGCLTDWDAPSQTTRMLAELSLLTEETGTRSGQEFVLGI